MSHSDTPQLEPTGGAPLPRIQEAWLEQLCKDAGLGFLEFEGTVAAFFGCAADLSRVGMGDFMSNEPTFRVRVDIDAPAAGAAFDGSDPNQGMHPRKYRLLVRPVMSPIMHDELIVIAAIAQQYGLSVYVAPNGGGIVIAMPGDID